MTVIIASIVVFLILILLLVSILLGAKAKLIPSGPVKINVNGEKDLEVSSGGTLLGTFSPFTLILTGPEGINFALAPRRIETKRRIKIKNTTILAIITVIVVVFQL
jgi:Na+-transporting NADH:ubiquinone oxidoreductase subunit NqrF